MADLKWEDLSAEQGFNFQRDVQTPIGHLMNLNVGGSFANGTFGANSATIPASSQVIIPQQSAAGGKYGVVGVLTSFNWDGGAASPWNIKALVGQAQYVAIKTMLHNTLQSTVVAFTIRIFNYDMVNSKYITSLWGVNDSTATNAQAGSAPSGGTYSPYMFMAQLRKEDKNLKFTISDQRNANIQQPVCYELDFMCSPQPVNDNLNVCFSDQSPFVKQWGIPAAS